MLCRLFGVVIDCTIYLMDEGKVKEFVGQSVRLLFSAEEEEICVCVLRVLAV